MEAKKMAFLLVGVSPNVFYHHRAHKHSCFELILNLEGSGSIRIGDEDSPFYPGSVHLIPPQALHEKHSEDGFRDIYIQLDSWEDPLYQKERFRFLTFSDDEEKTIESLLRMMLLRYLRQKKPDAVLFTMCELVMQLARERCEAKRVDPTVEKIVQQITLSFNDPDFRVSDVLEQSGYAKDYIRRRFIAETGMPPAAYLTFIRISNAKKLLRMQDQMENTIAEIAAVCGYYDPSYFSRVFKRETGQNPAEYAKET
jgi:AraC-like DNA-binding protein